MLICKKIKTLLDKWKRTPSRAIKQNGLNIIFWLRSSYTGDENRKSRTYRNINTLALLLHFFSGICYCLLSLLISPASAGLLVWSIADTLLLLELSALCTQLRQFHPGIHRHWMLQFSIFPHNHSTQKVSLKLLIFCCAWNENKTREGRKRRMIVKGYCLSQPSQKVYKKQQVSHKYKNKDAKSSNPPPTKPPQTHLSILCNENYYWMKNFKRSLNTI